MGAKITAHNDFKAWILQDAWDVFWQCRSVIAAALLWMVLFAAFDAILPRSGVLGPDGAISVWGGIWFVARFLIDAVAVVSVAFCAHVSVLTRLAGWSAFSIIDRRAAGMFFAGMMLLALLVAVMILIYQLFLVPDILRLLVGNDDAEANTGLGIGVVVVMAFLCLVAVAATWGGAVICGADPSLVATWSRGKATFRFVLWRMIAVFLVLPVIAALFIPVTGQVVAIVQAIGIPADTGLLVISAIFNGATTCFVIVLLSVIFSRAFIISLKS
ncbi:hypothetical protein [Thalassospira sp. CH_XMU1448-2]|uniref:hypothetical protein n=1 Tax=Thalassospira sp. CH_XMU1448-2 TaxID=3107773 RepID=UPI003009B2A3